MIIAVPKEIAPGERRVALDPVSAKALVSKGIEVRIEAGAGVESGHEDSAYEDAGASVVGIVDVRAADLILKVAPPTDAEIDSLREGTSLISFLRPLDEPQTSAHLAERKVSAFSMEFMPRITRAQSMDALSSQSTIAGYRAVLLAASALPRIFPMLVTAAGTLQPAKVFVIGAGVAGLQALGTAKRLGAVTSAYDTRDVVREQVQSMGAKFVELDLDTGDSEDAGGYARAQTEEFYQKQRAELARHIATSDVVISTALVPGMRAPLLVTEEAVKGMKPGSVVVDLAAANGGNCELAEADRSVVKHGVTIIGNTNLPAEVPGHASQMYAKNLVTFLDHLLDEGELVIDLEDEITSATLVAHEGVVRNEAVKSRLSAGGAD
ncbi:MAG: Re/Si-specific NAD(P)(+) transhydrogenase subunit alpha [Myxococcota bacterium]